MSEMRNKTPGHLLVVTEKTTSSVLAHAGIYLHRRTLTYPSYSHHTCAIPATPPTTYTSRVPGRMEDPTSKHCNAPHPSHGHISQTSEGSGHGTPRQAIKQHERKRTQVETEKQDLLLLYNKSSSLSPASLQPSRRLTTMPVLPKADTKKPSFVVRPNHHLSFRRLPLLPSLRTSSFER